MMKNNVRWPSKLFELLLFHFLQMTNMIFQCGIKVEPDDHAYARNKR